MLRSPLIRTSRSPVFATLTSSVLTAPGDPGDTVRVARARINAECGDVVSPGLVSVPSGPRSADVLWLVLELGTSLARCPARRFTTRRFTVPKVRELPDHDSARLLEQRSLRNAGDSRNRRLSLPRAHAHLVLLLSRPWTRLRRRERRARP